MRKPDVIMRIDSAWKELSETIDKENERYLKSHSEEELANNHFVIWAEKDIPFQLGRFLLDNEDDGKFEFHLEISLASSNFDGYKFADNGSLEKVRKKLGKKVRVDFLVDDMSGDHFAAIGEAKYFRYSVKGFSRGNRTVMEDIDYDFQKLKTFLENHICKYGVYLVVDNYYHRREPQTWKEIAKRLDYIESKGIYVFRKEV